MPVSLYPSGYSRRSFLRLSGLAATIPLVSEGHLARAALQAMNGGPVGGTSLSKATPVMINANENPLGPCDAALAAVATSAKTGGRYDANGEADRLRLNLAEKWKLPADHVLIYAGSSQPLHYAVLAFTSPSAPYVTADPTYEAGTWAAQVSGAPILKIPLTPGYAHDLRAMVTASPKAGLLYICNPNNPTGTLTPHDEIVWAEQNKPKNAVLLIDEAYIHYHGKPSCMDLVQQARDVIVLRTFSKIYGMAGIRCGAAVGRPDLLKKLQRYGMNPMPVTAAAAANASLATANLVADRRKINADIRSATFAWLDANGWRYTPSVSNCFMVDTTQPGRQVIEAMRAQNVYIGRTWPVWPNHVRITVGTAEEMAKFQTAFATVMANLNGPNKNRPSVQAAG